MLVTVGRGEPLWIEEFGRAEFLAERWRYRAGQHVTILAPTDGGKTTLTLQLLEATVGPRLPALSLALKPRDVVMARESKRLGFRVVRDWPPVMLGHPNGWTLWPRHTANFDVDDQRHGGIVEAALKWAYFNASKGGRTGIVVNADEMEEIQRLLIVAAEVRKRGSGRSAMALLRGLYRRMRSNGGGMWTGCQAPRYLVTDAYSQASHLFLGFDPDERNRDRFGEIGGVDPRLVAAAVAQLPRWQWLYIRRDGRVMCIVGP